jgi:hypothetical protein
VHSRWRVYRSPKLSPYVNVQAEPVQPSKEFLADAVMCRGCDGEYVNRFVAEQLSCTRFEVPFFSSPSQREDFTDPQSGHCRKNNDRAERFVTRSYESSNFFCRKKPVRTLAHTTKRPRKWKILIAIFAA